MYIDGLPVDKNGVYLAGIASVKTKRDAGDGLVKRHFDSRLPVGSNTHARVSVGGGQRGRICRHGIADVTVYGCQSAHGTVRIVVDDVCKGHACFLPLSYGSAGACLIKHNRNAPSRSRKEDAVATLTYAQVLAVRLLDQTCL